MRASWDLGGGRSRARTGPPPYRGDPFAARHAFIEVEEPLPPTRSVDGLRVEASRLERQRLDVAPNSWIPRIPRDPVAVRLEARRRGWSGGRVPGPRYQAPGERPRSDGARLTGSGSGGMPEVARGKMPPWKSTRCRTTPAARTVARRSSSVPGRGSGRGLNRTPGVGGSRPGGARFVTRCRDDEPQAGLRSAARSRHQGSSRPWRNARSERRPTRAPQRPVFGLARPARQREGLEAWCSPRDRQLGRSAPGNSCWMTGFVVRTFLAAALLANPPRRAARRPCARKRETLAQPPARAARGRSCRSPAAGRETGVVGTSPARHYVKVSDNLSASFRSKLRAFERVVRHHGDVRGALTSASSRSSPLPRPRFGQGGFFLWSSASRRPLLSPISTSPASASVARCFETACRVNRQVPPVSFRRPRRGLALGEIADHLGGGSGSARGRPKDEVQLRQVRNADGLPARTL